MESNNELTLLAVALAFAIVTGRAQGQASNVPDPNFPAKFVGSSLTCSSTSTAGPSISVPQPLVEKARLKARLAGLLRESLYDDAKGIVNIARENEIRKLANKLVKQRE